MFTGLIEQIGTVSAIQTAGDRKQLQVRAADLACAVRPGDSVAVNGCCLTVTAHEDDKLSFDLLEETILRTNLRVLKLGSAVNLERALAAGSPIGGHFVQGHIDGTANIIAYDEIGSDYRLEIALPHSTERYLAEKGAIAINGISLTVAQIKERSFVTWIIPHTRAVTNLSQAEPGDLVNLEFDVLAKYVERMLSKAAT